MTERRGGIAWLLAAALLALVPAAGCGPREKETAPKAWDRVRVEDATWEVVDGRNLHEFTLVNSNDLAVKGIVVRFHYLGSSGEEVATADQTFPDPLRSHDAVRKAGVDTGPTSVSAVSVRYEVVKARTILMGGKN